MLAVAAYCGGWTAARKNVGREVEEARRAATEAAEASQRKTVMLFSSDGQSVELP